jgi:hypothetical protein
LLEYLEAVSIGKTAQTVLSFYITKLLVLFMECSLSCMDVCEEVRHGKSDGFAASKYALKWAHPLHSSP